MVENCINRKRALTGGCRTLRHGRLLDGRVPSPATMASLCLVVLGVIGYVMSDKGFEARPRRRDTPVPRQPAAWRALRTGARGNVARLLKPRRAEADAESVRAHAPFRRAGASPAIARRRRRRTGSGETACDLIPGR